MQPANEDRRRYGRGVSLGSIWIPGGWVGIHWGWVGIPCVGMCMLVWTCEYGCTLASWKDVALPSLSSTSRTVCLSRTTYPTLLVTTAMRTAGQRRRIDSAARSAAAVVTNGSSSLSQRRRVGASHSLANRTSMQPPSSSRSAVSVYLLVLSGRGEGCSATVQFLQCASVATE